MCLECGGWREGGGGLGGPVRAECGGELPGRVEGRSESGATIVVEPMGVVQANNELKELEAKEEKEIDRILYALSGEAANFSRDILWDYDILVHLDLIFARGELSYRMNSMRPELKKDGSVCLRHARHPLLDPAKAVPIDIELGRSFDTSVSYRSVTRFSDVPTSHWAFEQIAEAATSHDHTTKNGVESWDW